MAAAPAQAMPPLHKPKPGLVQGSQMLQTWRPRGRTQQRLRGKLLRGCLKLLLRERTTLRLQRLTRRRMRCITWGGRASPLQSWLPHKLPWVSMLRCAAWLYVAVQQG